MEHLHHKELNLERITGMHEARCFFISPPCSGNHEINKKLEVRNLKKEINLHAQKIGNLIEKIKEVRKGIITSAPHLYVYSEDEIYNEVYRMLLIHKVIKP